MVSITEGSGTQISLLWGISGAVGEEQPAQLSAQGPLSPAEAGKGGSFPGKMVPEM